MPTAFVTGANGFLGLNIVEQLLAAGWSVTAMHRASSDTTYLERFAVPRVVAELDDSDAIAAVMPPGMDTVFHVAGDVSYWRRYNDRQTRTNVDGTRNVVEAALRTGARRYVQTSSISSYGIQSGVITEETPSTALESGVNYMRTKWLADEEVRRGIARGLDAVLVQPASIFGKYDTTSWARLIRMVASDSLPGMAAAEMNFCHAGAVARAHIAAAERGATGERYLLGGTRATMLELVQTIAAATGGKAPSKPTPTWLLRVVAHAGDLASRVTRKPPAITPEMVRSMTVPAVADTTKAVEHLGFEVVPLRDMIDEAVAWLRSEGLI